MKTKETWEIRSSFSPGFTAAAGFEYKVSSVVSFWAEVSLLSMSLYVKEADLTAFSLNDRGIPLYWINGTKNISYGKNVALDSANLSRQPAYTQPFSNLGINMGARLSARGKGKKPARSL